MKNKTELVLITAMSKQYKRFEGRTLTDFVTANRMLTAAEIETFRVDPESMYDTQPNDAA